MKYINIDPNNEHIERHFAGSLTPGSKFFPLDKQEREKLVNELDQQLAAAFEDAGENPGRIVLEIDMGRAIGTDALVKVQEKNNVVHGTRDAGTPHEQPIKMIEKDPAEIPTTSIITVIGGPYGPTENWGVYTMFPGAEAPPFPNQERQQSEDFEKFTEFWDKHGFYATEQEISASQATAQAAPAKDKAPIIVKKL